MLFNHNLLVEFPRHICDRVHKPLMPLFTSYKAATLLTCRIKWVMKLNNTYSSTTQSSLMNEVRRMHAETVEASSDFNSIQTLRIIQLVQNSRAGNQAHCFKTTVEDDNIRDHTEMIDCNTMRGPNGTRKKSISATVCTCWQWHTGSVK